MAPRGTDDGHEVRFREERIAVRRESLAVRLVVQVVRARRLYRRISPSTSNAAYCLLRCKFATPFMDDALAHLNLSLEHVQASPRRHSRSPEKPLDRAHAIGHMPKEPFRA